MSLARFFTAALGLFCLTGNPRISLNSLTGVNALRLNLQGVKKAGIAAFFGLSSGHQLDGPSFNETLWQNKFDAQQNQLDTMSQYMRDINSTVHNVSDKQVSKESMSAMNNTMNAMNGTTNEIHKETTKIETWGDYFSAKFWVATGAIGGAIGYGAGILANASGNRVPAIRRFVNGPDNQVHPDEENLLARNNNTVQNLNMDDMAIMPNQQANESIRTDRTEQNINGQRNIMEQRGRNNPQIEMQQRRNSSQESREFRAI